MQRRVTYVVHQFLPDYFTGTEQYVFAIAKEMQRRGHDVEVYCLDPDFAEREPFYEERHETVEGLPVVRFRHWMHLGRDFSKLEYHHPYAGLRFADHLRARRPDVVHAFHLRHLGANLLSECAALGIPSVVHLMDFWFLCPRVVLTRGDGSLCDGPPEHGFGCIECVQPWLADELRRENLIDAARARATAADLPSTPGRDALARAATFAERPAYLQRQLELARHVVAPSEFLRRVFLDNGYAADRIEVIRYGVDPARLGTPPTERPARDPSAPLRVGYFGSIAEHKGVDLLVEAFLRTPGALELSIHGRTSDFAEFSATLAERAAADDRISFRGPFPRERLGDALREIDVLAVPSRWYENTPFVVLEAFAGGVPVVATDLGGIAEIVEDEVNGDLFPRDDVDALASRLERLEREPDRLERYRAALPRVKTLAENVDEIERLY
ncbi:MAG: glycosyltransferase family 4 protein [Planctomycetes bacterium]|nr:glycosyltransferase family 4 protein [Planctomycetota bacterium]